MNEKELLDIEQGLRSKIQEEWPTWEQIEQLIAEVRKLRKPLIVSSTIKKLADENKLYKDLYTNVNTQNMKYKKALEIAKEEAEKEYIRGVKDTQCELIPKIDYEKEQNKVYKMALEEIAKHKAYVSSTPNESEVRYLLSGSYGICRRIAKKALEVKHD